MLHYVCLSMSSSLNCLSASPLSPCQRAIIAASRKRKLSPSSLAISLLLCLGIFLLLSICKRPQTEIFYLSFPLEMKRQQYRWIGSYGVYIFACFSSYPWFPSLASLIFSLCLSSVCVHSSRQGYFTIFCGLRSQLIICGWIFCPGSVRELKLTQEFLSNICRGWNREALLHTDELGMDWARAEVWVTEKR